MNPSDPHSSLTALRQLKEMLDAGTITPQEFEALKRQVIFGAEPALPLTPSDTPSAEAAAYPSPEAPAPAPETTLAAYDTVAPNPAELPPPPPASPDWLAAPAPALSLGDAGDEAELPPLEERRNPLNLVFAIGGLLVFLGVVAYLLLGRPAQPDEHLTSGTQTAADSTAAVPEVGPQAEQLTLPPAAAPETIRVAPVVRAAPANSQFSTDSAAAPAVASPAPAATAAPASKASATKVPVATPAASPAATDSASKTP